MLNGLTKVVTEGTENPLVSELLEESQNNEPTPLLLMNFSSSAALAELGPEKLKLELMSRGLKCGGTLQERADRLFSVRGLAREQINPALFAKPSKGTKK